MTTLDEKLLTREGMAAARAAITEKYSWFLHAKPLHHFEAIKEGGLRPRNQGLQVNHSVAAAIGGLVANVEEVICFKPLGSDVFDSTPWRGDRMFMLAIPREVLPKIVTVDWTFGGTWGLAPIIKNDSPASRDEEIFCEVVRRRGSILVYEAISPDELRVWTKGLDGDAPSEWPQLVKTDFSDVQVFG